MSLLIYRSVVSCVRICSVLRRYLSACATERMLVQANGVACDLVIGVSSYSKLKTIYFLRFLSPHDSPIESQF